MFLRKNFTQAPLVNAAGRGRTALALALLVAVISLPFLHKPFHIDDPFFLHITANILADPLDPFAGEFDWWARPHPTWTLASNPPLLNYYLAPFAALSGFSEWALHAAMLPFTLLLAAATLWLTRRFTASPWLALLFVMSSAGVVVSGNVMLDVPATALGAAAMAAVVAGTDRGERRWLLLGSVLAGCAVLTRYSAAVLLPLLALYPILHGRSRFAGWLAVPLGMLALWCLHNLLVYGEPQILAQLARPYNRPAHAWRDNLCGLPVTLGSLLYLFPLLLAAALARRDRLVVFTTLGVCAGAWWASQRYLSGAGDWQFLLWSLGGCVLLVAVAIEGLRGARPLREAAAKDSAFLLAWLAAHVLFAVLFVPFQAVRNVLPALLPLTLLAFRALARGPQPAPGWLRPGLLLLLALQASVAGLVAAADYQFAAAYRDFAASAESRLAPLRTEAAAQGSSWFLGHWGWLHYAERAGLHKAQTIAPFPQAGELLVIPAYVDKGRVLALAPRLAQSLRKVEEVVIPGSLPLRTVHPAGAGFYAQFSRSRSGRPPSVPYRLLPGAPLEIFEVYRVAVPTTAPR